MRFVDSWRAARDLRDVMFLDRMGWGISLRAWRMISLVATPLTAALSAAAGLAGVVVFASVSRGDLHATVTAALVGLDVYIGIGFAMRCIVGAEREFLARHPFRSVYCALDVPKLAVVAQRVLPRLGLILALELAVDTGAFIGMRIVDQPLGRMMSMAVVTVALAIFAVCTAIASRIALHEQADRSTRCDVILLAIVASASWCVGASVGWTAHFVRSPHLTDSVDETAVCVLTWVGLAASTAIGVVSIASTVQSTQRLADRSWSAVNSSGVRRQRKRLRPASRRYAGLLGFLLETSTWRAYMRVLFATTVLGATVVGMLLVGASVFDSRVGEVVARLGLTVTFVAGLTVSDVLLSRIGPHSLETILRYAYEQGRSSAILAAKLQAFHVAAMLVVVAPVMAACVFGGAQPVACAFVAAITSSAGLLASAVATASRSNNSGQASGSPAAILLAVMISASAVAVAAFVPIAASLPSLGFGVLALGGSTHACLQRRIIRRPSSVVIL